MYDVVYIGGGLNYAGAVIAAKNSLKVALIEKSLDQLGGVCLHKGCIPSKMFLHYANTVLQSKDDIFSGKLKLNMQTLVEKKKKIVKNATKAIVSECKNIELIEAEAKLIKPHTIQANDKIIEAKHVVIGTGSSPFIPKGIEYNANDIITSDEVLNLHELPKSIAIYGDGAIGLEMATFFASLGVLTTLISRHEGLLKKAHPLIQSGLKLQFEKLDISHLENHPIAKAKSTFRGVHIIFEEGHSRYFDTMLVATGRKPNTQVIQTDSIKVSKGINSDDFFETTLKDHYAVGDCNGKLQLAHAARAQVINATLRILGKNPSKIDLQRVVKFIHTQPMSYAAIGKTKAILEKENVDYKQSVVPLNHFTNSLFHHASNGYMIVYADKEDFILGAEILAPDAEELISPVAMALAGEMDAPLAQKTIMAHPTFSEALERAYFRL